MQPIGIISRMLKSAELRYPIIEKEALAIGRKKVFGFHRQPFYSKHA
jgi:hypothetical protein